MHSAQTSSQTLIDTLRRSAARHPHKLAIKHGARCWTYAQFYDVCARVACQASGAEGARDGAACVGFHSDSGPFGVVISAGFG